MVTISLPDGAKREFPDGATGTTVAEAISRSLAKKAVAMKVDGALADLSDRVPDGASIAIVTRDDPAALDPHPPRLRARAGGGGADTLPRHPGDDRAGDGERLLL